MRSLSFKIRSPNPRIEESSAIRSWTHLSVNSGCSFNQMRCGLTNFITERSSAENDQVVSPPGRPDTDPLLPRGAELLRQIADHGRMLRRRDRRSPRLHLPDALLPGGRVLLLLGDEHRRVAE